MPGADAPRIAAGEPVALVLGAGGARGLAQIGVIEALQARGLRIVAVAGSSSGALVARPGLPSLSAAGGGNPSSSCTRSRKSGSVA